MTEPGRRWHSGHVPLADGYRVRRDSPPHASGRRVGTHLPQPRPPPSHSLSRLNDDEPLHHVLLVDQISRGAGCTCLPEFPDGAVHNWSHRSRIDPPNAWKVTHPRHRSGSWSGPAEAARSRAPTARRSPQPSARASDPPGSPRAGGPGPRSARASRGSRRRWGRTPLIGARSSWVCPRHCCPWRRSRGRPAGSAPTDSWDRGTGCWRPSSARRACRGCWC